MKKVITVIVVLMISALVLSACGSDESREDANDVHNGQVEKSSPNVISFNNHYPNVETKCDGFGHRIYVITHDSGTGNNIIVIPDKTCQGPGTGYAELLETNKQPAGGVPSEDMKDYPTISIAP